MNIGIPKERTEHESRVALVPGHVGALRNKGYDIMIEKGAGLKAGYPDSAYQDKGVVVVKDFETLAERCEVILAVRAGAAALDGKTMAEKLGEKHILIGMLEPYQPDAAFDALLNNKVTAFSMEMIPRTTRAQSMDVLSSMANLAGYKAVLIGADYSPRMFPMMMTAAGTIPPSNVFVLGVGVAGLQAIATSKRLGAVTSAYDVRPEVREQVTSLGAKFVEFDLESAEGEGGYAKEMDEAFYKKQQALMKDELATKDVVITTANIPGKKAPILITEAMVKGMKKGSVIVDLAAERGGNCALSEAGKTVTRHGVTIAGPLNLPASLAFNASALYSKNITTFLDNLWKKDEKDEIDFEDDIVEATLITKAGKPGSPRIESLIGRKDK